MKKIFLALCCVFSFVFIMPIFAKAYTAPNNQDYDYKVIGNTSASYWYTIYSNKKICFCSDPLYSTNSGGTMLYQAIGLYENNNQSYAGVLNAQSGSNNSSIQCVYPSGGGTYSYGDYLIFLRDNDTPSFATGVYFPGSSNSDIQIYESLEDCYNYLTTPEIDFETIYYDPTVPTPSFNVYMTRPDTWQNITEETNFFNISWSEYSSYYIQIGYKYSVPNSMKVGVTDGNKVYTPLSYFDSSYYEIYSLENMHSAIALNADVNSDDFIWQSYSIDDPESWQATVPPWVHNYNNSAYVSARNNWNDKLAFCMPLYGNRLEIFARLFYVEDNVIYVGAWRHWNNSYPTEYGEELPQNYQVDNAIPGYQNTNNNTEYQEQTNTITSIGEETGKSNSTTIINNLTPNYPDYPTAVTYNHDNILLQMIDTTKRLPSFFGDFTDFCKECMTVIPSDIWEIIAFGFLCSILVMIVKVL